MSEQLGDDKSDPEFDVIQYRHDTKVPRWLLLLYLVLPFWGLYALYAFWGGSQGWTDRGFWHELQVAARTTPATTSQEPSSPKLGDGTRHVKEH